MRDDEKAIEISSSLWSGDDMNGAIIRGTATMAALKMAEWKDQQTIEYLYKNILSLLKDYGVSEASADIATQLFLANFKKAMEK